MSELNSFYDQKYTYMHVTGICAYFTSAGLTVEFPSMNNAQRNKVSQMLLSFQSGLGG